MRAVRRYGNSVSRRENPEIYANVIRSYPLRRIGEPVEIAGAAVFLASAAGTFTTGQTIVIDGGSTIAGG